MAETHLQSTKHIAEAKLWLFSTTLSQTHSLMNVFQRRLHDVLKTVVWEGQLRRCYSGV
jgi:hypothetical protein